MRGLDEIRAQMRYYQITQTNLEAKLNRGHDYISKCFSGHKTFTIQEGYIILDLLNLPHERFCEFFPPLPAKRGRIRKVG